MVLGKGSFGKVGFLGFWGERGGCLGGHQIPGLWGGTLGN